MTLPIQRCLENLIRKFSIVLQMFLSMIRVPQTCFEIALIGSSSKGQTLDTRRDSSLSQGEDEEVADGQSDNYPKIWIPTVM